MSLTKLQLGLAGAVLVAGAGIYAVQERDNAALRAELAGRPVATGEIDRLHQENMQLGKNARQFANLQVGEAELAHLRGEVAAQQQRLAAMNRLPPPRPPVQLVGPPLGETLPIGQLDARPKPAVMAGPVYPAEMAAAGVEGSVVVSFIIDTNGQVHGAKAVDSTRPEFEAAAVAAVEQWQFDPGRHGGRSVNTRVSQRINFNLANGKGTAPAPKDWF